MAKKTNAVRELERAGVTLELREYEVDEDDLSAPAVAHKVGLPVEQVFKTLVARAEEPPRQVMMACIPGAAELDLKKLAAAAGAKKVDLVPLKDLLGLTGYVRGGCSPVGAKKPYPVYLDQSALDHARISVSAGQRGLQMFLAPADLARVTGAKLAKLVRE
mgnify:CR=1 FL=1